MGNRGRLHNSEKRIVRPWAGKAWITCLLEFKGRHREIMAANSYTELFFLDEATAFSAGHRPCGECRRQDFLRFKNMWRAANPRKAIGESIKTIDAVLHQERIGANRQKRTFQQHLGELPDGAMFSFSDRRAYFYMVWQNQIFEWSSFGYKTPRSADSNAVVNVLTPKSIIRMLSQGYARNLNFPALAKSE